MIEGWFFYFIWLWACAGWCGLAFHYLNHSLFPTKAPAPILWTPFPVQLGAAALCGGLLFWTGIKVWRIR